MSAADTVRAELASGFPVTINGESLVSEACAHRALIVRGGES
jgi:hypothetical protein